MSKSDSVVRIREGSDKKLSHLAVDGDRTKKGLNSDLIDACELDGDKLYCEIQIRGGED